MEQMHAFYLDSEYKIRDGGCGQYSRELAHNHLIFLYPSLSMHSGSGEDHHIADIMQMAKDNLNSTVSGRVSPRACMV
jgi:hypothetical protein